MLSFAVAILAILALAAFGIFAARNTAELGGTIPTVQGATDVLASAPAAPVPATPEPAAPTPTPPSELTQGPIASPVQTAAVPSIVPPAPPGPTQSETTNVTLNVPNGPNPPDKASQSAFNAPGIRACDKPGGMGLERVIEIDTTRGPGFGTEHFKQSDFLRDHEVVLTFDDGPWPENTAAVIKALTDQCLKATFFEIGEHARWHPELSKMVAAAGMTIGSHTWSHKFLAKEPYASDIERAKNEIEMGVSAVHAAVAAPIAPFFRFPGLQQSPALLSYLGQRSIATFSTDIDSFDFKLRHPQQVIRSVMTKLMMHGKGIVLMHDFQRQTAAAMPELLRQLNANGFKVVHIVARAPVTPLPKYDDMVRQQDELSNRPPTGIRSGTTVRRDALKKSLL
jgi:peptidoglycan/xylan/chitin deacetylase (PgdA/CDA1 family)